MSVTPKREKSSLEGWAEAIEQSGRQYQEKRAKQRQERCEFLRNYFRENPSRIQRFDEDRVLLWKDDEKNREVILNEKFADDILANEKVLEALWEEIARRASFDEYLLDMLEAECRNSTARS